MVTQLSERSGTEIRQLMLFPVRPQILYWVQFRRIAGKKLYPQTPSLLPNEVPHRSATMTRQTVPDNQQLAGNMAQQMREKLDDLPLRIAPGNSRK